MSLYAEKLLSAVKSLNDPIKSTSTTTAKANGGIDLSGILMMLMMNQMFKQPKAAAGASDIVNPMDVLGPMSSGGGFGGALSMVPQGSTAVNPATGGALGTNMGIAELLRILQSLGNIR